MVEAVPASCPKCGAPRRDERACPRCGLAAARMASFAEQRDAALPDALMQQWERTTAAWDDAAGHDELLRLVTQHDAYAWSAAKYRDVLRTRPDDAIATRQLDRVRRAAEATMLAGASPREDKTPKPYRQVAGVLVMLVIIVVAGLLVALVMRQMKNKPTTPSVPAQRLQLPPPPTK